MCFKHFLIKISLIVILFSTMSCGTNKKIVTNNLHATMKIMIDESFNRQQFDSLCVADTINPDYTKWLVMPFVDYETNETVHEYVYIKKINEDEIMYRLIIENCDYKIIKRITDN